MILDREDRPVRCVAHRHGHRGARRVAGDVGEGLLGAAEQRQARVGGQRAGGAVDPQGRLRAGVPAEVFDQGAYLVHRGQPVAPQRTNGLPCVGEPFLGQVRRPLQRGTQRAAGRLAVGELAGPLELDRQAGQGVREHVVEFTRDAAALGERRGGCLCLAGVLQLGHQQFGAVLAVPPAPDELAGHRQQQAQQCRGEGGLCGGLLGQRDRHGEGARDQHGGHDRGPQREPHRGDPDANARRYLGWPVRLQRGQGHPAPADEPDQQDLEQVATPGPGDCHRRGDRYRVPRQGEAHSQPDAGQARGGMAVQPGRDDDRDEHPAHRPEQLALAVHPLAGARACRAHPGRRGDVLGAVRRRRPGWPAGMHQARRGQPCLHGHSLARGGHGYQVRHGGGVRHRCRPGRPPEPGREGGRSGGQVAPADVDHGQAGQHIGQRHHDQRGDPGGRAGDLVRDAEPGDRRARAVAGGDGEGHPGADTGDPQAGGEPPGAAQGTAVGAAAQLGGQPGHGAHRRAGRDTGQFQRRCRCHHRAPSAGTARRRRRRPVPGRPASGGRAGARGSGG